MYTLKLIHLSIDFLQRELPELLRALQNVPRCTRTYAFPRFPFVSAFFLSGPRFCAASMLLSVFLMYLICIVRFCVKLATLLGKSVLFAPSTSTTSMLLLLFPIHFVGNVNGTMIQQTVLKNMTKLNSVITGN